MKEFVFIVLAFEVVAILAYIVIFVLVNFDTTREDPLGPLQRAWVESLKKHPERQMKGALGRSTSIDNSEYNACCLGEILCVLYRQQIIENPFSNFGILYSGNSNLSLPAGHYNIIGLRNSDGYLGSSINIRGCNTLARLNDSGYTWPQIAKIIEDHYKTLFNKRV